MAAPSFSSFSYAFKYDVFLSFRGQDTRKGFTGHLYKALRDRGIHTFIDDEELPRGEKIPRSLVKAIEESRIAIVVFSENYASSSFCLDELIHIMDCISEKGRLVLPVFYDLDPSHVRHQRGSYEDALKEHEERFKDNKEKLQNWRMALREVANLSGYHFRKEGNENEYEFIGKIVKEVSKRINRTPLHVADYPVGLESRVWRVFSLLKVGSGGVHMVGIHGIGGVGKTTIARAIYNLIADQFEGVCFLDNVRENSIKHGLLHLQETLLSKTIGENVIKLGSVNEGIPIIRHRLCRKKILFVLDDVDELDQLRATVGGTNWFGSGSKVIITTRDKHLLTCHEVKNIYEVDGLNMKEALALLSWSAFKSDNVDPCYKYILNRAVTYASGLPLALEVIGSNLFGKSKEEWESALDRYERIPNKKIQNILKVSFDSLEEDEQEIFLDIACCFKGYALSYVKKTLRGHHGFCPEYGIGVLIKKSLIKIDANSHVTLHDLIEDMGKEIVRQESPEAPGKRSRLWFTEDIVQILVENTGTSTVQIIILDFLKCEEVVEWDGNAFKDMKNLKTLIIREVWFSKGPNHLPNSLRVLEWWRYPSSSLPSNFHPKKLAILELPQSCLVSLEFMSAKKFADMRILNFDDCQYLKEIPDVSGIPNLEELSFGGCDSLSKIHESVGFLKKLKTLNADCCRKFKSFPPIMLTSLEELKLSYCNSLENFPEILGDMENISVLDVVGTPIKQLPFSIQHLTQLQKIVLNGCGIVQLPSSISMMRKLKEVVVGACEPLLIPKQHEDEAEMSFMLFDNTVDIKLLHCNLSYKSFEGLSLFPNVKRLILLQCDHIILPACIKDCCFLTDIRLEGCMNLQEIQGIPPNLENLFIRDCSSLKDLDLTLLPACLKECYRLRTLTLDGCKNLLQIRGILHCIVKFSAKQCTSLKDLDLITCTREPSFRSKLILDNCESLQEIRGFPSNFEYFSAKECTSLKVLDLTLLPTCTKECYCLSSVTLDGCKNLLEIRGIPFSVVRFSARHCTSLKDLDLTALPTCTKKFRFLPIVILDGCKNLLEITGIPTILWYLSTKDCPSLTSGCRSMLLNIKSVELWDPTLSTVDLNSEVSSLGNDATCGGELIKCSGGTSINDVNFTDPNSSKIICNGSCYNNGDTGNWLTLMEKGFCEPVDTNQQLELAVVPTVPVASEAVEYTHPLDHVYCLSDSEELVRTIDGTNDEDQSLANYLENAQVDSSRHSGFAETQNIQALSLISSSSDNVTGEELHLKSCYAVLPTTVDESFKNQIESSQDDVEMETFYADIDDKIPVLSHLHVSSTTNVPDDEAREALNVVLDFFSNDASILLHPAQCSVFKAKLDYLSKLSAYEGISGEVKILVSEASQLLTHWSSDFIETSRKIESTASELLRLEKLEADLRDNKKQFREVQALEKELFQKFANMEEKRKELEEHTSATDVNNPAQLERSMLRKSKRDIFEEGMILKAQMDELREKVPHFQAEQSLAKKTQTKIATEWSNLREKFGRLLYSKIYTLSFDFENKLEDIVYVV